MINDELNIILDEVVNKTTLIFENKLKAVILYGSYARGDYDDESDIDIALLVNSNRMKLKENDDQIVSLMTELNMKYDVLVSFASIPIHEFNKYKEVLTYYKNIEQEGVKLSVQ